MIGPTPPSGFVDDLRRYDPRLRLRWAWRTHTWFIERQMPPQHPDYLKERPSPLRSAKGLDLWDGWQDGYLHVLTVHPDLLDNRVFEVLADCDMWRQGRWQDVNQRLDAEQEAQERAADRGIDNWAEAATSDAYDRLKWLQGERIATPMAMDRPPTDDRIEQHEGFLVRDRRQVHMEPA